MLCTGIAGATDTTGTFYTTGIAYHGPAYNSPSGSPTVSCYTSPNQWIYESVHFLIYGDSGSSDDSRSKLGRMADTEYNTVTARLGVTDTDLGIVTTDATTKLHICSDSNGTDGAGGRDGVSMPALDGENVDPLDRLHCYAGYRKTIRHEMVHVVHGILTQDYLGGDTVKNELWFSEGLAVYLSDQSNLSDTVSLAAYFTAGRPNPVTVKTRADMPGLGNKDVYPAFALAVKYLFDTTERGGAGNNVSSLKSMFQQINGGTAFTTAFASTFSKGGSSLPVATYSTNFSSWMSPYLSALETTATITGASGISMVGIFKYWCDMILGIGATVTSGNFALNVSELADGPYALCAMDSGAGFGPVALTVSGGRLTPTSYNVSTWTTPVSDATIPINYSAAGGTGTISVISSDVCGDWHATSNDLSWITITGGSSGTGDGTVTYSVAANSGAARTGSMIIGIDGKSFTVNQAAPPDTTPNPFTFTDRTNVALSTEFKSNAITVSGINTATPISVSGGTYSVNGAAYTSASSTVSLGNTVKVRKVSAGTYSTTKSAILTIGGVSDTFSVTTMANPVDTTPDAFTFTDRTGVALSTEYKSNAITVSGINAASPISVAGGTYSINGAAYTSVSGTVNLSNTVKVRKVSAGTYSTTKSATLTIGGVSDTFSVTTMATP